MISKGVGERERFSLWAVQLYVHHISIIINHAHHVGLVTENLIHAYISSQSSSSAGVGGFPGGSVPSFGFAWACSSSTMSHMS